MVAAPLAEKHKAAAQRGLAAARRALSDHPPRPPLALAAVPDHDDEAEAEVVELPYRRDIDA